MGLAFGTAYHDAAWEAHLPNQSAWFESWLCLPLVIYMGGSRDGSRPWVPVTHLETQVESGTPSFSLANPHLR